MIQCRCGSAVYQSICFPFHYLLNVIVPFWTLSPPPFTSMYFGCDLFVKRGKEACACIIPVTQTRWRWDLYHLKEKNTMWSNSNWTFTVNKSEFNTFLRVSSSARPHMSDRYCNLWCWRLCSELINVSFPFSVQVTLEMLFYVPDERVSAALIRRRAKWMG